MQQALAGPTSSEFAWNSKGRRIALDILHGIAFLHRINIIHRDLKTSNILLSAEGVAKLADVGMAKMLNQAGQHSIDHATGTFVYAAPEILLGGKYTYKVDIFSFGVILWELVTLELPVRGFMRALRAPLECPQGIADLIARCLSADPKERPAVEEIYFALRGDGSSREGAADVRNIHSFSID